ncbi:MAG: hypothetical protein CMJ18_05070 [Phycisphaeraceae bacterium]|nr:hypothetical protein [Phycisphaeraceae bacterium]
MGTRTRTIWALTAAIACIGVGLSPASAQTNLNDYTLNFVDAANADEGAGTAAALGITNPGTIDEWRITIHSVVVLDAPGGFIPANIGTTFTDYFAIQVDSFVDRNGDPVVTPGYGTAAATQGLDTHEITIVGSIQGTLDSLPGPGSVGFARPIPGAPVRYDVYFDSMDDQAGNYTLGTTSNWSTFDDGIIVEQMNSLAFGLVTTTVVAPPTLVDGSSDIKGPISDVLSTLGDPGEFDEFELSYLEDLDPPMPGDGPLLDLTGQDILHTVDGNFTLDPNVFGANGQDEAEIDDFLEKLFGFAAGAGYDPNTQSGFGFRSDASINKEAGIVPEPLTAGLGSVALGVLAGYMSRRRRVA